MDRLTEIVRRLIKGVTTPRISRVGEEVGYVEIGGKRFEVQIILESDTEEMINYDSRELEPFDND
jgi:hypothetical protein